MTDKQILDAFVSTKALLQGHFVLRSGLHSDRFFQAALLLQHTAWRRSFARNWRRSSPARRSTP